MSNLENNFSIYPYNYNELADNRAMREYEEQRRAELADKLAVDMGVVAMAAVTGIAGPEYKEAAPARPSTEQIRKLGAAPVGSLITLDPQPSFMTSLRLEQSDIIDEQAILGHAEQQEYRLAA